MSSSASRWTVGEICRAIYQEAPEELMCRGLLLVDKRWCYGPLKFDLQDPLEESMAGFLQRTMGSHIVWISDVNGRRGDGSVNGQYYPDLTKAIHDQIGRLNEPLKGLKSS